VKLAGRIAGTSLALVMLLLAGSLLWVRSSRPSYDGVVRVAGLAAPAEVWWDSLGVPHIHAASLEDLVFVQGWVHASERLWQMELLRRVAEGRLSEFAGAGAESSDRFLRTLGLWRAAGEAEAALDSGSRRLLERYAAGVNARIARRGVLPPEFLVTRVRPEPWTVRHSLAAEKVMAWDLSQYWISVSLSRAVRDLGPDLARHLYPRGAAWGVTILEDGSPAGEPPAEELDAWREVQRAAVPAVPPLAQHLLERLSARHGSNGWVVGPSRSASGRPLLANDMHLGHGVPGIWYLVALHGGGVHSAGMSLPGGPLIVAGHNRAVAWGFTNATLDDMDFLAELPDTADPTRYRAPEGSLPFEVTEERIQVRGRAEPVTFQVRRTRNGPVISDADARHTGLPIALRWAAAEPAGTFTALLGFNLARSGAELIAAAAEFQNPHQNIVWADTAGSFGYILGGRIPLRRGGRRPPLAAVPGWTGEWDWTGFAPVSEHPRLDDPERGYVVTANNRQTAGAAGERISLHHEEPYRALRITELVRAAPPLDAAAVHRHQLDVTDATAGRFLPHAVAAAESAGLPEAAERLRGWDLRVEAGSRGAALYVVWLERLRGRLAESLYGERGWMPWNALFRSLSEAAVPWLAGRDTLEAMAAGAMRDAWETAAGRSWGELHRVLFRHELAAVPLLDRLLRLNVGPAPAHGSSFTVNVSHRQGTGFPAYTSAGVSQRHVVDMADVDGAGGFILPAGQSGSPFSRHYRDQFARWRAGGLWRIPLDPDAARARRIGRTELRPAD
jgi:penicillin G amidase